MEKLTKDDIIRGHFLNEAKHLDINEIIWRIETQYKYEDDERMAHYMAVVLHYLYNRTGN